MTIDRDGQRPDSYQGLNPVQNPPLIRATRAPTTLDRRYKIGTKWINSATNQIWFLTSVVAGSATWALASPGASDVDTLTADSGGAISPAAGNITLAGGTNITTAGAGSTITTNLDDDITLTSVTADTITADTITADPLTDLTLEAATGEDIIVKMGDAAGANIVSFTDSADVQVASVGSDGNVIVGNLVSSGPISITGGGSMYQLEGGAATDYIGQATLVGGTVTVANTNIANADRIFVTRAGVGASTDLGVLTTSISASTSFTITSLIPGTPASTQTGDLSVVNYFIVRQL